MGVIEGPAGLADSSIQTAPSPAIETQDLRKTYRDRVAVSSGDLQVAPGTVLGLLGPNGAGKTTTLRMLTGFLKPTSGNIQVGDYRMADQPLAIKRILGYLPESAPLYHDMIVYDYLRFVAAVRGMDVSRREDRIREIAGLCGIESVMHQPIGELSKGYKHGVGLAHAMMSDPEVLVLDEPTSGLDPNQIVEIREIIRRIGKAKTVIFSTHILSEAEATCDRVLIIHRGRIAADSSTARLKETLGSRSQLHVTLRGAEPVAAQRELAGVPGVAGVETADTSDGLLRLVLTCAPASDPRADVYGRIRRTDWVLLDFHQETQSLEDIFRELTKEG
jgi:ABC-2 type transport system ATP-binding protein